mgnify:FL=1|jgi:hypothetical protein|tara:strand:+ start:602 stop:859 length:258 start_codon:yes stop_codon:yes gene_type:complete
MKKKIELNYAALIADEFDVGHVVGEHVARQIFERRDKEFALQYATLQWKKERARLGTEDCEWDSVNREERGQYWRFVYRYYPQRD